ncbi:phosphatidylserine decarboxylase family protein [candidate division KSB1 bacterium]|nr:phosphatidylserine decarboxylase family protein [candidate division KSB1 bacterium]
MAKHVWIPAIWLFCLALISTTGAVLSGYPAISILAGLAWSCFAFVLFFFRDPERAVPGGEGIVLAPADGKILTIEREQENMFMRAASTKISIFMSPFNVHVNRIPISGKIAYLQKLKGKFWAAYRPEASAENEQAIIGIDGNSGKVLFKQIAGVFARRIICDLEKNQSVEIGRRFGLIKFGSRVDIFLPLAVELQVKEGQKTIAGQTILGVFPDGETKSKAE